LVTTKNLREASGSVASAEKAGSGPLRLRIRIIEGDVQGSSGYYPAAVVERDGPKAFPRGTHMHMDHMSFWDMMEGSPGKLETLAGIIDSTPVYETVQGVSGLYADCIVVSKHAQFIEEVKDHIGVSILAACKSEVGVSPVTGEETDIVTDILGSLSVDFVTHPGANGRIISALESAPNLWPEGLRAANPSTRSAIEQAHTPKEKKPMADITEETAKELKESQDRLAAAIEAQNKLASEAATKAAETPAAPDEQTVVESVLTASAMLAESGLPKEAQSRAIASAKTGTVTLEAAIESEKTYVASVLAAAEAARPPAPKGGVLGGLFVTESERTAEQVAEADTNWMTRGYGISVKGA
jgi:hypothetical protein